MNTNTNTKSSVEAVGPRRVGGRYYSRISGEEYQVLDIAPDSPSCSGWEMTVLCLTGYRAGMRVVLVAAWDPGWDRVVGEPSEVPSGQFTDDGLTIFEPYRRADSTAGMSIRNPHGVEPWRVDVVSVGEPDEHGMVVLATRQGVLRPVARDWPCAPHEGSDG